MHRLLTLIALAACGLHGATVPAADPDRAPLPVTVDTFRRAETDTYFGRFVRDGAFGAFKHERTLTPIDHQSVIRMNRDTLYSYGVFDLDAAPVTFTLPDPGSRYMAVQVIDQDQYAPDVFYAPGTHTLTRAGIGTRYVGLAIRTFVNPADPADVAAVHALQDAVTIAPRALGSFDVPAWDPAALTKVREALLGVVAANGGIDSSRMFGRRGEVDPVQHLLGTAAGWGGNPPQAAIYAGAEPSLNDGTTPYRLTVGDVPVDGFWSVSVYNKLGFFEPNARNAYTINNVTAQRSADGSVTIHFGGDETAANFLPITPGWNYVVRLYRPRPEILDHSWRFPEAEPVK